MKPIVFAIPGNEAAAHAIAEAAGAETGASVIRNFPDEETYVRVLSEVKNRKVIIVCALVHPDKNIMPLYFLSRTLKSMGAASICLVAPYLAYMRQDKAFNPGEGITSAYFASLISDFADQLITIDPHLHRWHSLSEIYSIPCTVIHASSRISEYIRMNIPHPVLIGPDSESSQWVSEVAKKSGAPFIILEKIRSGDEEVRVTIPQVEKFKNHTPVLVDDIIATASTMIETAGQLKNAGMNAPACIAIHALFTRNAHADLLNAGVKRIITCNTISHSTNGIDIIPELVGALDAKNQNT